MSAPGPQVEREALLEAVERLEEVVAGLKRPGAGPQELTRLAGDALALSATVAERLPKALREAEAEADGADP